jgi:hypothetical protein
MVAMDRRRRWARSRGCQRRTKFALMRELARYWGDGLRLALRGWSGRAATPTIPPVHRTRWQSAFLGAGATVAVILVAVVVGRLGSVRTGARHVSRYLFEDLSHRQVR